LDYKDSSVSETACQLFIVAVRDLNYWWGCNKVGTTNRHHLK